MLWVKKVKPALYSIVGKPWKWVHMSDLVAIFDMEAVDIWDRFFSLSKDLNVLAVVRGGRFANVTKAGEFVDGDVPTEHIGAFERSFFHSLHGCTYVPAGWALDVIKAWETGARKVEVVYHEHQDDLDECPKGTLSCVYADPLHAAVVGLDDEGKPIQTNYGQAPRHESGCCDECWFSNEIQSGHFQCSIPSYEAVKAVKDGDAFRQHYDHRGWQVVWR
jgi:hypothetical protein